LRHDIDALAGELNSLEEWCHLAESPFGVILKKELSRLVEITRSRYSKISASKPDAAVLLAETSAWEYAYSGMLSKLENMQSEKERLDREMSNMLEILKSHEEALSTRENRFVSAEALQRRTDAGEQDS